MGICGCGRRCRASSGGPCDPHRGSFPGYHRIRHLPAGCRYLSLRCFSCTTERAFEVNIPGVGSASKTYD